MKSELIQDLTGQHKIADFKRRDYVPDRVGQIYREIAGSLLHGFAIMQEGKIVLANQAFAALAGLSVSDVVGSDARQLIEFVHPDDRPLLASQLRLQSTPDYVPSCTTARAVPNDGPDRWLEFYSNRTTFRDKPAFHTLVIDITEKRMAQRRLEAQSRLAAVGQLASGIAHDFNNILGTIILQSEMLLNGPHLSAKDRERLAVILNQSQRAAKLTDQIMDFSHRTIVALKPLDLTVLAQSMQSHLQHIVPENIEVRLAFEEGNFIASADAARLQQVFTNLALNSRDAMPDGGEIVIGISRHTIKLGETRPFREMGPGDWIHIRVSDTGEGIKPEHLAHVFEPFFTTKPPGKGSGLGLAQVYGIIKQHKGFVDVQSQEGHGATFTIHLPAVAPIPEEVQPLADMQALGGKEKTILVVEVDASTRDAIGEILRALNYEVLLVSDGMEALGKLKQARGGIDLVLADMAAPKMRLADFHNQLRETGMQIPMIIMTGHPIGREDQERLILENLDWIQKPFSSDALSRKVRQALAYM